MIKVLTVPGKDTILGATIVGVHAGDLMAEYVLAMKQKVGLKKVLGTIHIYPTLAESNKAVAGAWQKAHTPERLLGLGRALPRVAPRQAGAGHAGAGGALSAAARAGSAVPALRVRAGSASARRCACLARSRRRHRAAR